MLNVGLNLEFLRVYSLKPSLSYKLKIKKEIEITITFEVFGEKEMFATVMEQEPGGE